MRAKQVLPVILVNAILGVSMDDKNDMETFMSHSTVRDWKQL
jgi:hypothetical protein